MSNFKDFVSSRVFGPFLNVFFLFWAVLSKLLLSYFTPDLGLDFQAQTQIGHTTETGCGAHLQRERNGIWTVMGAILTVNLV